MAESFAFDQNQRRNFDSWLTSNDAAEVTPDGLYRALGVAPGAGNFKPREELQPGFLDKFLDAFGVQTDKVKELKTLTTKQKQLEPFVNEMLKLKAVDLIHRNAQLRAAPESVGDAPAADATLGFGGSQSRGLQPAPSLGGDPAMAGMPLGASSANAAAMPQIGPPDTAMPQPLSDGGRFMTPDALVTAPMPLAPTAGVPGTPNPMQYGSGFDDQGRPLAPQAAAELPLQPIRPEPIAAPMPRAPMQAPAPPRKLKDFERFQAAKLLQSQAEGHLVPGQNGTLVPYHPDAQLLDANQQQELADIAGGARPSGRVKLPGAQLMQAIKGKAENSAQDLTGPVREYIASKGWVKTPENIDAARQAVAKEKQRTELEQIAYKEGMQMYSKDTNDELGAMGVKNPIDATAEQIDRAIKTSVDRKISKHARELTDTFNASAIDPTDKEKLNGLQQIVRVTNRIRTEFTPEERREFVGKLDNPKEKLAQFFRESPRFAQFDALVNREMIAAFETGGKALTAQEAAIIFGFLPTAKEWSPANFEAKLREADDYAKSKMHTIVDLATANRSNLAKRVEKTIESQQSSGPATITSDEDYNKLPSGTLFVSPDGKTRRKP